MERGVGKIVHVDQSPAMPSCSGFRMPVVWSRTGKRHLVSNFSFCGHHRPEKSGKHDSCRHRREHPGWRENVRIKSLLTRASSTRRSHADLPVVPIGRSRHPLIATPNQNQNPAIPSLIRGAYRDRHERWVRDAVDVGGASDESVCLRTAKSCGCAPTARFTNGGRFHPDNCRLVR